MLPWKVLDTAPVPGGRKELRLKQRGKEFVIMLDKQELMSSYLSVTEKALATFGCDSIKTREKPRVLIGGLGMGYTLQATLQVLGDKAEILVAELVPAVVKWARGPLAHIIDGSLDDPRVAVHEIDVGELIRGKKSAFDAILLDVDNGPDGLTRSANDALYETAGLAAAHRALRKGGVLAVWSSTPDAKFTARLKKAGFAVKEFPLRANGPHGGAKHFIWTATRTV
ncbi:MAG: spermidine synthase [Proteobacteria bacterium]|nr:spermidine synthase [Pseudomonadota bacterium]